MLYGYRIEMLLYMMAATERKSVKKHISDYLTKLRSIQPSIAGKDLKRMGLVPGPVYREILAAVRDAKLDGKLQTRNDELNFARNYMS